MVKQDSRKDGTVVAKEDFIENGNHHRLVQLNLFGMRPKNFIKGESLDRGSWVNAFTHVDLALLWASIDHRV